MKDQFLNRGVNWDLLRDGQLAPDVGNWEKCAGMVHIVSDQESLVS